MRFIIRKFVDAETVSEALALEPETPVHDAYLKEGEEPSRDVLKDAIGFQARTDPEWRADEIRAGRKR